MKEKTLFMTLAGILIAAGAGISIAETAFHGPLPWMKPGLANVTTLLALLAWNFRPAMTIAILRVMIAGLITGTIFSLPWTMALVGGVSATCTMYIVRCGGTAFGPVSISVSGAIAHNFAQAVLAVYVLGHGGIIFAQLPYMLIFGVAGGIFTGIITRVLLSHSEISALFKKAQL